MFRSNAALSQIYTPTALINSKACTAVIHLDFLDSVIALCTRVPFLCSPRECTLQLQLCTVYATRLFLQLVIVLFFPSSF